MKNFELAMTKVAASQMVEPPMNAQDAIASNSLVAGMMFGAGTHKKEAGTLTEKDANVLATVYKVCKHAADFADKLNEKTAAISEFDAVESVTKDFMQSTMLHKLAYTQAGDLSLLDKHFDATDILSENTIKQATAIFKEANGAEVAADDDSEDEPSMGGEDQDMETAMAEALAKKKQQAGMGLATNEAQLQMGGGDMNPSNEDVEGQDELANALRAVNSSTYQTEDTSGEEGEGGEPTPEETAAVLQLLQAHMAGEGQEGGEMGEGEQMAALGQAGRMM